MKKLDGLGEQIQIETMDKLKEQNIVLKGDDIYVNGKRVEKGNYIIDGNTIIAE